VGQSPVANARERGNTSTAFGVPPRATTRMRQHLVERGHFYPKECLHSRYTTQENRRGQGKHALVPRMKRRARDVVAARAGIQHTVTRQPPLTRPYVRNARSHMPRAFQTARQLSHHESKNNNTNAQACPDRHEGLEQSTRRNPFSSQFGISSSARIAIAKENIVEHVSRLEARD
jgi:hypothetical protein